MQLTVSRITLIATSSTHWLEGIKKKLMNEHCILCYGIHGFHHPSAAERYIRMATGACIKADG
jgi:hypothetical protein